MKKRTWIVVSLLFLIIAVAVTAALLPSRDDADPSQPEPQTVLYWNVEQAQYEDPIGGGSKRRPGTEGIYTVVFSVEGEQRKLTCDSEDLIDRIDSMQVMGLDVDKTGRITQVYSLEELGYGKTAWRFYVRSIDADGVVHTDSSKDASGEQKSLTLPEDVQIYCTTTSDMLAGLPTDVRELDRIMGVTDAQGQLTHIYVIERTYTGTGELRYCQHCKQEVKWWSWDKDNYVPEIDGHFYLTTDVQLVRQCLVRANQTIVLDLQGHTVTGKANVRIYATWGEGAYLGIMDSSPQQTGKLVANGTQLDQGGCLWIRFGTAELFSGTLDASTAYTLKNGAGVFLKNGATFNMYGGTILGGTSLAVTDANGKVINGCGGNLYIEGVFNMYAGTVSAGRARGVLANNTSTMGIGGNLYVTSTGEANLFGGVIEKGESNGPGANIYTNGLVNIKGDMSVLGGTTDGPEKNGGSIYVNRTGTLLMEGGTVSGGTAVNGSGGNIASYGTVKLVNATVTEGSAAQYGPNLYALDGVLVIEDSTIGKGVRSGKNVDFSLVGTVNIESLELPSEAVINVDKLSLDSSVTITASGYFTKKTGNNCSACFKPDGYSGTAIYTGSRLVMGRYRCLCGGKTHESWCDGTKHMWQAWTEKEVLPTKDGYYYLTRNVTRKYQTNIGSIPNKTVVDMTLDLNGKTVTGTQGERVWMVTAGSTLSLTDTVGGGTVKSAVSAKQNGGVFMAGSGSVFNFYAGTIRGTTVNKAENVTGDGGAGSVLGTMNMYGGSIVGGNAGGNGGNLMVVGTLNLLGGTICDGSAGNLGGNVYCSGQVNISGGTVSGGQAGNATSHNVVAIKGSTVVISGGTIDGGIRQAGAATLILKDSPVITGTGISIADGVRLTIEGTLADTAAVVVSKDGSWLYFADTQYPENAGAFTVPEGYEICFDESRNQLYYKVYVEPQTHSHDDDTIQWIMWDGTTVADGEYYFLPEGGLTLNGRVTVNGIHVTLCLNGQTLTGKTANRTFFILGGGSLTICDCSEHETGKVVAQGINKESGGSIMVGSKSTLNLQGGTIMGGSVAAGLQGGNIIIVGNSAGNGVLNMTGGRITGGNADTNAGANVYIGGTLNISGGQIDGLVVPAGGTLSKINISGSAKILGEETSLYLPAGKLVNVEGVLEGSAKIGITLANGKGVFTQSTDAQNAAFFEADGDGYIVSHNGAALELVEGTATPDTPPVEPTDHNHCYCDSQLDHEHVTLGWTMWDADPQKLASGGYYALEDDMTLDNTIVLGSADQTPQNPVELYLCLNGKTLTAPENKQAFLIYSGYTLNICDCSEEATGQILGNGKFSGSGGLISIAEDGALNQYGGSITGGHSSGNGGNIAVTANASYTLYNGKVTAGTSSNLGGNLSVSAGAVFTMMSGEISGGSAKTTGTNSNNIIMAVAGTIDLRGGYIQGGIRATNGTVKLSGTIRITDGTVSNLSVNKNSIIKITGQLTGTQQVGVSGVVIFSTGVTEDVSAYFFADTAGKTVVYDPDKKELKLV